MFFTCKNFMFSDFTWKKNILLQAMVPPFPCSLVFNMASEIIKADNLHLFLLSDGTRIDDNEYLESQEKSTELIICTEEQIQKLPIYFKIKRYLTLKNVSYPLIIYYFI